MPKGFLITAFICTDYFVFCSLNPWNTNTIVDHNLTRMFSLFNSIAKHLLV